MNFPTLEEVLNYQPAEGSQPTPLDRASAAREWQRRMEDSAREAAAAGRISADEVWAGDARLEEYVQRAIDGARQRSFENTFVREFADQDERRMVAQLLQAADGDIDAVSSYRPDWEAKLAKAEEVYQSPGWDQGRVSGGSGGDLVLAGTRLGRLDVRPRGNGYEAMVENAAGEKYLMPLPSIDDIRKEAQDEFDRTESTLFSAMQNVQDRQTGMDGGAFGRSTAGYVDPVLEREYADREEWLKTAKRADPEVVARMHAARKLKDDQRFTSAIPGADLNSLADVRAWASQFTVKPLLGAVRSFAQAADALLPGPARIDAEGAAAADVLGGGAIGNRVEQQGVAGNQGDAPVADLMAQAGETLIPMALSGGASSLAMRAGMGAAGRLVPAARVALEMEAPMAARAAAAGRVGQQGGMLASSFGARSGSAELQAQAAESAGDLAKAERIRRWAGIASAFGAGVDAMSELIFPAERLVLGGVPRTLQRAAVAPFQEAAEEGVAASLTNPVNELAGQQPEDVFENVRGGFFGGAGFATGGLARMAADRVVDGVRGLRQPAAPAEPAPAAAPAQDPTSVIVPPPAQDAATGTFSGQPAAAPAAIAAVPPSDQQAPTVPPAAQGTGPRTLADVAARVGRRPDADSVPELPETLAEQRARVLSGVQPAMLVPGVDALPEGLAPRDGEPLVQVATDDGVALVRPEFAPEFSRLVAEGRTGDALGYGVPRRPQNPTAAVVLRNAQGIEVQAAEVDDQTQSDVVAAFQNRAQPGDSVTVEPREYIAAQRARRIPAGAAPQANPMVDPPDGLLLPPAGIERAPVTRAAVPDDAAAAVAILNQEMPGLADPSKLVIARNGAQFVSTGGLEAMPNLARAGDGLNQAEGFYDPQSGRSVVFLDQVVPRKGEDMRRAIGRVIVHERVGHGGFFVMAQDQDFSRRWRELVPQIPRAELDALVAEGYGHLRNQPEVLAFEWFARRAERELAPQMGGLLGKMWAAVRAWLDKAMRGFSRRAAFDAEVRELVQLSRGAAQAQAAARPDGQRASMMSAGTDGNAGRRAADLRGGSDPLFSAWQPERFERVIPRDLFNEAKILAMTSKFAADVAAGKMPAGFSGRLSPQWSVALSEDGELYISGLDVSFDGYPARIAMSYNAGKESRFPLTITVEDLDIWGATVYDETGKVDSDMQQFKAPPGAGKIAIPDWSKVIEELKRLGRIGLNDRAGIEPKDGSRGFADSFRGGFIRNIVMPNDAYQAPSSGAGTDIRASEPLASEPVDLDERRVARFNFTVATSRVREVAKLLDENRWEEVRRLNEIAIRHAFSDLPGVRINIQQVTGVFQGPEDPVPGMEPSVIVSIGYDDAGLLDQVRARMIDLSVLFAQDELHEVSKAEDGAVLGEVSADGTIVALAAKIGTGTLSRDEVDGIRKQAGFAGMAIADGEIIAYDPDNEPEAFHRKTSEFARIAGERQEGAGLVEGFRIRLGRFGRDDSQNERVIKYGRSGVPDGAPIKGRVRSELIRRLPSLVDGALFAAPDKRSYFTAADLTPRQVALQMRIADEFDAAPVMDRSPETFQAYRELAEEVAQQYDRLVEGDGGMRYEFLTYNRVDPITGQDISGDVYSSSRDAVEDIRSNSRLRVLKTEPASFGPEGWDFFEHPLLQDSGRKDEMGRPLLYNDLFRAVHDTLAHGLFADQFGPIGEEAAWNVHIRTIKSVPAKRALTTETRGQNSWVNYGPQMRDAAGNLLKKGDVGWKSVPERGFALQKAYLAPLEFVLTGDAEVDAPVLRAMDAMDPLASIAITVAPVRSDELSELTPKDISKRASSAKFVHMQVVIKEVADAFGVPILSRQAMAGGWNQDGQLTLQAPEVVVLDTDDWDLATEIAATIGASTPEIQSNMSMWQDDPEGDGVQVKFRATSAAGAKTIYETLKQAGVSGFTYDPKRKEFSVAQPKLTNKFQNEINRFLKKAIADGSARAGQSAEIVRGRGSVIKDSQLGGIHRRSTARAEKLGNQGEGGAAQAKRIGQVVDRAKRRLKRHNQAKGVGERAAEVLKTLPIPKLSARAILDELKGRKFGDIREFGLWVDDRFARAKGFGQWMVDQVGSVADASEHFTYDLLEALSGNGSGMGWYDDRVQETIRELQKLHPEFHTDPDSLAVYIAILATTSQGYTVVTNFRLADQVYNIWKETKKMPLDFKFAKAAAPILSNLAQIQGLIDTMGLRGFAKFMDREVTGRALVNQFGRKFSGVTLTETVRGNRILGPKIGSFMNNLRRRFDTITMDLWYTRTMHRYLGGTVVPLDSPKVQQAIAKFRSEVTKEGARTYNIDLNDLDDDESAVRAALAVFQRWSRGGIYIDKGYHKFDDGYAVEKAARRIFAIAGMKGAPQNKAYRKWFAQVVLATQARMKELGFDLNVADIQAIIWYREKDLFKSLGLANAAAAPADYLDAVMALRGGIDVAEDAEAEAEADVNALAEADDVMYSMPAGPRVEDLIPKASLGGTRMQHKTGTPFRVRDLAMRTLLTGSPLPRVLVDAVDATERSRQAVQQTAAQIGKEIMAAAERTAERVRMPIDAVYAAINDVLNGVPGSSAALRALDPTLAEYSRRGRNMIDDLSEAIANTLPTGSMADGIMANLGTWMRRSYAAFDPDSGWNYDNLAAAADRNELIAGRPARQILRDARRLLMSEDPQATAEEIEATMRDMMDRDTVGRAIAGSSGVRKNVTSLVRRKEIAPEIRALMGEESNPIHRFAQSAAFQAQFLARHEGQHTIRRIGLAANLFRPARGGVYTEQIPVGEAWSPLAGLWTTPQLLAAMRAADGGVMAGTDFWGLAGRSLTWLAHRAKLNRVALNPDSWVVNALGNIVSVSAAGDVFYGNALRRFRAASGIMTAGRAGRVDVRDSAALALLDQQREMSARLVAAGVTGNTFSLGDLEASIPRQMLQWIDRDARANRLLGAAELAWIGQALGRGFGMPGRLAGAAVGAAVGASVGQRRITEINQRIADLVMQKPDLLARLTGFLGNLEASYASGLRGNQAFDWAAERTRNTFPDYGKLPAAIRDLSRIGVLGSFVAFQFEVYRNYIWNLRYIAEEMGSANPALRRRGIARLAGMASVSALAFGGLGKIVGLLTGVPDDDERARAFRRQFAAPWERGAQLEFVKYDQNGVQYFNPSYLLPPGTMAELLVAARSGEDPADAAGRMVNQALQQFAGGSVNLSPVVAAVSGFDAAGRRLSYQPGLVGTAERIDAAAKTMLDPGYADKVERLIYAARGAERKGRAFSGTEEALRLAGVRAFSRTWPQLVENRLREFAGQYRDIRAQANKELGLNLPGAATSAVAEANQRLAKLAADIQRFRDDAKRLGVPASVVYKGFKDSALPTAIKPVEPDPRERGRVRTVGSR